MPLSRLDIRLIGALLAALLIGATAVAQYSPLVGLPLAIGVALLAFWFLVQYGEDL